jgi:eukaryotic-like serine/threonine-protein kinase
MTTPTLREVFEGALALPVAQRPEYLDRSCPVELRPRVEAMLAATATPTGEALPMVSADALADAIGEHDSPRLPPPGTRIGPFELVSLLGEGGHASVFRAFRDNAGVRQEVALKLLRHGVYTAHAQRQFRRERQALSQLHHPGIARLIEGDVTESGVAYIALELVDGLPITQFARDRELDLRARLRLMLQVCRAVEAAHASLVVHRDLKPSNVLVTRDAEVKLLDFGVAKLLEDEDETQTRGPGFTPAYAAPEQLRGEFITTATDVYALGVMLGELATGRRVNAAPGRTPSSQVDADTAPGVLPAPAPITRGMLRGDLDNIVLKAIESEPARRYASAGALADDLERYLAGEPVAAHPPSRLYRMRKFVARHRLAMAGTALFSVAVLAALAVALWQADRAQREATRATEQTQRAEAVRDFLVSVFESADTGLPREKRPTVEQLVDEAAQRARSDKTLGAATRADLLLTLASVSVSLGANAQALAALDAAQPDLARDADAADDHRLRAARMRAAALIGMSRDDEAITVLEPLRARMIARADAPAIEGLRLLAHALATTSRLDESGALFEQARQLALRLPEGSEQALLEIDVAQTGTLATAHRFNDALELAQRTWDRWQQRGAAPDKLLLALLQSTSTSAESSGDMARAERAYRDAIALAERLYARPHPDTAWAIGIYGSFLVAQGRYDDAEPHIVRGLEMRRTLLGDAHPDTLNAIAAMGRLRSGQTRTDEAAELFAQGIALCRRDQVRHNVCPRLLASHAQIISGKGQLPLALEETSEAVAMQSELTGARSPQVAPVLGFLARLQVRQGNFEDALRTTDDILQRFEAAGGMSKDVRYARFQRALALFGLQRYDEALVLSTAVVDQHKASSPDETATLFTMLTLQARLLSRTGRKDQARLIADEALAIPNKPAAQLAETTAGLQKLARTGSGY